MVSIPNPNEVKHSA